MQNSEPVTWAPLLLTATSKTEAPRASKVENNTIFRGAEEHCFHWQVVSCGICVDRGDSRFLVKFSCLFCVYSLCLVSLLSHHFCSRATLHIAFAVHA